MRRTASSESPQVEEVVVNTHTLKVKDLSQDFTVLTVEVGERRMID